VFKVIAGHMTEISRNYGILAVRFQQAHDKKISPEELAKVYDKCLDEIEQHLAEVKKIHRQAKEAQEAWNATR
jgi:hypothetical protein